MTSTAEIFAAAADILDPPQNQYLTDPVRWVHERLEERTWSKQDEILESLRDHRYLAVHSAHDLGKSFIAARAAAWWMDVHPPGDAFVVSTAPTFPQVRAILWREIGRAHRGGNTNQLLPGRVNQTEWWIGPELVGYGRKPADTDQAAFQGIHARYVLVIIDEACGVPKGIFDAVDALATNEAARVLAIGNPDDASSHFAQVCKPGSGWHVIHLDGLESPNFTGEPIPADLAGLLLSPTWVEERKERWGENSPLYLSKVRGLFPEDADDGVVRASKLAQCMIGQDLEAHPERLVPIELGIDVGAGGDESVIRERRGLRAGRTWRDRSKDPEAIIDLALRAIIETGATSVKIDSVGIGWGIAGWLENLRKQGQHQAEVHPVHVGMASTDPARFPLLRDQIWWELGREFCETNTWDLAALNAEDDDTAAQLLAPKYGLDAHGRIKIERKDETRKRIGRSPDDADALLLAFFVPPPLLDELVDETDFGYDEDRVSISPI